MPDDFDIKWNDEQILGSLVGPFHQANEVLGRKFQTEITAKKWDWPSDPSPRDIVDTGELRRSYVGEREAGLPAPEHSHSWNTEYAMAAHEGARLANGDTMPARPWTKEPLEAKTLETAFEKLAKAALGRIQ